MEASLLAGNVSRSRISPVLRSVLPVLVLTLIAIVVDQFAAPLLFTTSPLWATCAFLLLVWRRFELPLSGGNATLERSFPMWRMVSLFFQLSILLSFFHSFLSETCDVAGASTLLG